ncbi:N-acetyl-1-D-myo-inositol-2-amino-2-deoxy-alpha-D-glucopyranoside deacetylase [Corynebacterium caspium]|uniref:N-acetyl-1-D-myo-inositol-2-amino-2-deoxy-alpha- D-glucopyranoside deacetylase n=1 Tax=Corynebacterium caspium TaxID=234828 RepID=UPI00035EBFF1|nr:N-acetyl-1-D-myo-inositol-2-amino-2-deoxy-alpha-D-glucopyranoside deacetylase [Corynebacterium caspium]WKD59518.1 1D-myo-inositol 2-acetamido-2-deoxy-alpha-D-glucopyranoside deacetylase [Corynebacterium caspium DSM 44850]
MKQNQIISRDLVGLKVVAVHAHPDDEVLSGGGTLAHLARRGADITVVTCTLGEEGEVIGAPFANLIAEKADQLGGFRIAELQASLAALGVRGRFLGGAGQFRDSGMVGSPAAARPAAFVNNKAAATAHLAEIFAEIAPQLVITYGPDGGYGHPDHIQAHEITHAAAKISPVGRILWSVNPTSVIDAGLAAINEVPKSWHLPAVEELATVSQWDLEVALPDLDLAAKLAAMRAHATQIWLADNGVSVTNPQAASANITDSAACAAVFALSNLVAQPVVRSEFFQVGANFVDTPATSIFTGLQW